MRRDALRVGLVALALTAGCKSTGKVDPMQYAAVEVDPRGAPPVAPPGPGDVSRRFPADRGAVAKSCFRTLSTGPVTAGDFAIDQQRGRWFFQKDANQQEHVRLLRGRGPGGKFVTVELKPEGAETVAIVRAGPNVDEALGLAVLDKVEDDLKAHATGSAPTH